MGADVRRRTIRRRRLSERSAPCRLGGAPARFARIRVVRAQRRREVFRRGSEGRVGIADAAFRLERAAERQMRASDSAGEHSGLTRVPLHSKGGFGAQSGVL